MPVSHKYGTQDVHVPTRVRLKIGRYELESDQSCRSYPRTFQHVAKQLLLRSCHLTAVLKSRCEKYKANFCRTDAVRIRLTLVCKVNALSVLHPITEASFIGCEKDSPARVFRHLDSGQRACHRFE